MKDQVHDEDKDVDEDLYRPYDDCTGHVSDCIDNSLSFSWLSCNISLIDLPVRAEAVVDQKDIHDQENQACRRQRRQEENCVESEDSDALQIPAVPLLLAIVLGILKTVLRMLIRIQIKRLLPQASGTHHNSPCPR